MKNMQHKTVAEFSRPYLQKTIKAMEAMEWEDVNTYSNFLAQTYYHICHSTRLLAAAGARFTVEQDAFHLQCMKHAAEERSHEKLSLSDLKELGFSLDQFMEMPITKALYRSAYYLIEWDSPIAIFGYAYFLECMAASGVNVEKRAREAHGKKATKHLHLHVTEDPAHIKAYEKMLNDFNESDRATLYEAIITTADIYEKFYLDINAKAKVRDSFEKVA